MLILLFGTAFLSFFPLRSRSARLASTALSRNDQVVLR